MALRTNPPRLAEKFFSWFCHRNHLEGLEGDLYETFERNVKRHGPRNARMLYLRDIFTLLRSTVARPVIYNSKFNTMDMYKNYLHSAIRMGWKRKGFSFINLVGLTLGISAVIFISLFILDEIKYDKHVGGHENKYRVYDLYHNSTGVAKNLALTPPTFAPEFEANFPQIEKAGRLFLDYGGTMFRVGEQIFAEENGFFAETDALEILDIKLVHGTLESLQDPNAILLSMSTFRRFFGDAPFSEQTLLIGAETSLKVGGVYEDIPRQSHIRPDYFFSFAYLTNVVAPERMKSWTWQQFYTYVELTPGADVEALGAAARDFVKEMSAPEMKDASYYEPVFQNLTAIHLHSGNMDWEVAELGSYQSVMFLFVSALIILFIACLNFINLTAAQALKRAKEVVVRKFIGAHRSQLVTQYIIECLLYTLIAGVFSLLLVTLLLPFFNQLSGKAYQVIEILDPLKLAIFFVFLLLLGVVSGIYPALLLTSFKPLDVLHGTPAIGSGKRRLKLDLKQLMVGLQYVLSIGLVLISLIMQRQYSYLQDTDMGFDKENLLVIPLTNGMKADLEQTKNLFSKHSNILGATTCYGVPGGMIAGDRITVPENNGQQQTVNAFMIDEDYIPTMNMRLLAGRNFSKETRSDEFQSFIINETAAKNFGFGAPEEAIGRPLHWQMWNDADTLKKGRVVGVVEDFNYKSLHNPVENVVLQIDRDNFSYLVLKIGNSSLSNTLAFLEEQYRAMEPNKLFEFEFVDRSFQEFYESEQRTSQMFSIFTMLAIFTAAIGLFGLVTYSVISRGKEIGIRKVLGASVGQIFFLLVSRYFLLLVVSLAIALPLSYYIISGWLDNFAYRISIDASIFLLVIALTVLMTILTVGYQALKGANVNPGEKLRTE